MSAAEKVKKPERIRAWLKDNPDGGRASQIAGALKISTTEACAALHDMHATGELVRCKVEIPSGRAEYHYRFSATAGSPRHGQPWRTMTATSGPKPPRPEATTRPRGQATYPPKPASAPATVLPPVQAAPVAVQEPVVEAQNSVPAPVEQHSPPPSGSAGEAASGAPPAAAAGGAPAPAMSLSDIPNVPREDREEAIHKALRAATPGPSRLRDWTPMPAPRLEFFGVGRVTPSATDLGDALRDLERALDSDAPPARPLEEAIAQAAAEASRDWVPEPTPEPPPAMTPRFGLFSDGTLILEGLPNLPPIIAIHREHTRALVKYLLELNE